MSKRKGSLEKSCFIPRPNLPLVHQHRLV
uniref:Uncharacterized protein n=1 Tax=Ciona intestinalis TaxID=7719 RepID=H2Y2P5_CIOIN